MTLEMRFWDISYDHHDGRKGVVMVETQIFTNTPEQEKLYGKSCTGRLVIEDDIMDKTYDLRYTRGDRHLEMIRDWFGKGLKEVKETDRRGWVKI